MVQLEDAQAEGAEQAGELPVAGQLGLGVVVREGVPEVGVDVAASGVLPQPGDPVLQRGQVPRRGVAGDQLADQAAQRGAYLVDVAHLARGHRRDPRTAVGVGRDQSLALEGQQGLAYGRTAAAVAAGELDGVQVRARTQPAEDDLPGEVLDHVVDERGTGALGAEQPGEDRGPRPLIKGRDGHGASMPSRSTSRIRSAASG